MNQSFANKLLDFKTNEENSDVVVVSAYGYFGNSEWQPSVFASTLNNSRPSLHSKKDFERSQNINTYIHITVPNNNDPASRQLLGLSLFERILGELRFKIETERGDQPINFVFFSICIQVIYKKM